MCVEAKMKSRRNNHLNKKRFAGNGVALFFGTSMLKI